MKRVLVGSKALKHWYPGEEYLANRGKDIDYWTDYDAQKGPGEDIHNVREYEGLSKFLYSCQDIATPEQLYTLKVSHSFWPINWAKNMSDIKFLQEKGVTLDEEMFKVLYADWTTVHGKKRAYLKKTKEEFFNDNVKRIYEHDSIHRSIMYYSEPMYKKILKDGEEVLTDRNKFDNLSFEDKIKAFREEAMVTSLERFLIPSEFKMNPLSAYRQACCKLITSMSKGWFPKFGVENWNILHIPDIKYEQKFRENIDRIRAVCN